MLKEAHFCFYGELNDFLPEGKKSSFFRYRYSGSPSVKNVIECIGVPHTEVDLILVNGKSVMFSYRIKEGDRILVYPLSARINMPQGIHLAERNTSGVRFILDVHLGKLARLLRLLGLDTLYESDYSDREIVQLATSEGRIILTRDIGILKLNDVNRGYWIRAQDPKKQLIEVLTRFDLFSRLKPFRRCIVCNGIIQQVQKESVIDALDCMTKESYNEFYQCESCKKIYWKGSHYYRMKSFVEQLLNSQ